jgi:P-type E1-E2 ATPase
MIEIEIPGGRKLELRNLVLDYNGTIAVDGNIAAGVKELLEALSRKLDIHVVTADTFGNARAGLADVSCSVLILGLRDQAEQKLEYVKSLGTGSTVCVGNGRNDLSMLREAALGIAVILKEGAFGQTLTHADIICTDIVSALELLVYTKRLQATLRN